jgi:hypothetical protein
MASWTLPAALELLHQQFPGAFVTSGARDPNSKLGKANPRSYHNVGEAFDIRPMPGVDFNSYVQSLKSAGLPVVEALDEVKHPKPWTTGPNWHVAFAGDRKVAPIDMIRRAQAFNVNIPQDAMPPAGEPMSEASPMKPNIADLISKLPGLQPLPVDKPQKGSIWGAILGAISDGLLVGGGKDPIYAPSMLRRQEMEQNRIDSREKLNAEIAAKRDELIAKLQEQPQFIQNLQAYQAMPPEQQQAYLQYLDATQPIAVSGPQGTQRVPRTMPPRAGAVEDGYVFLGGDPADKNNWRPQ